MLTVFFSNSDHSFIIITYRINLQCNESGTVHYIMFQTEYSDLLHNNYKEWYHF